MSAPTLTEVRLEDRGQDFTRLYVQENGVIYAALPFQTFVWKGHRVVNRKLKAGVLLMLRKGREEMLLAYPVVSTSKLKYGICRYCKCRDERACEGGCSWMDVTHTLCDSPECIEKHREAA